MMIAAPQSEARSFVKTDVELQIVGPLEACPLAESLGKSGLWQARSIAVLVPCPRAGFTSAASRLCREKSPVPSHVCLATCAAALQLQLTNHSFGLSTLLVATSMEVANRIASLGCFRHANGNTGPQSRHDAGVRRGGKPPRGDRHRGRPVHRAGGTDQGA